MTLRRIALIDIVAAAGFAAAVWWGHRNLRGGA